VSRWLKLDAGNRAWRTILQGLLVTIVLPALVAGFQVLQNAVTDGGPVDWTQVRDTALKAAVTAAMMAVAAYLHRIRLDPSPIPSAQPPRPAGVTEMQAPATAPAAPVGP